MQTEKKCPSLKGYILFPIPTSKTWQSFLRTFTNTRHDHLKHFTDLIEIKQHLIAISSCMFFPGQTRLPNPGELGMMVQTRVTEKRKTYLWERVSQRNQSSEKEGHSCFSWYPQGSRLVHTSSSAGDGSPARLLATGFWALTSIQTLGRGFYITVIICVWHLDWWTGTSAGKVKVGCASSKGLSAILEHHRTFIKCIRLAWRETVVRIAGLIQVSHHGA